jgi:hypothetical protein
MSDVLSRLADAQEPLYNTLDEAQKRRFAILARPMRPGLVREDRRQRRAAARSEARDGRPGAERRAEGEGTEAGRRGRSGAERRVEGERTEAGRRGRDGRDANDDDDDDEDTSRRDLDSDDDEGESESL